MRNPAIGGNGGSETAGGKAIHMVYEKELLEQIEDYRYRNRFPTRVEAIKALVNLGLQHEKKRKVSEGK